MVMCNMDSVSIPRPPALPGALAKADSGSIRSSQGFRLLDDNADAGSVYSVYKQKIDSMFESDSSTNTKNSVQARIEKMFCDVARDSGIPANEIGCHVFSVDYLGSVPLAEKVSSLAGLQTPLRELYFAYKKNYNYKRTLTGRLEISSSGLKIQYQGDKGDLEQLNSFPTIAVWSAVKFVLHEQPSATYAFLPLITDPDNIDKQTLFRELEPNERKLFTEESHSPLFAVVMRKVGVHKQLECHGFVCQTSEDAIVIAATLYKSLMAHMKAKEMKPKNRNGVTCMSVASSVFNENCGGSSAPVRPPRKKKSSCSSVISERDALEISDTHPLLDDIPSKKSSKPKRAAPKAPISKNQDLDAILPYEEPEHIETPDESKDSTKPITLTDKWNTLMSNHQKQITEEIKQVIEEGANGAFKRAQSIRKRNNEGILNVSAENSGDILTKVTIPRSGSFLNAGGLTKYKSKVYRSNGQATGGSPLGFHELFNEFRLQEGLHSIDEILGVIIDPDGMSFNDLKPIYKEFLLKLALTLTKDELYQRSKAIMRRQKKKLMRRNSASFQGRTRKTGVVSSKFRKLGLNLIKKPLKIKTKLRNLGKKDDLSEQNLPSEILAGADDVNNKISESSISTSSYDTRQFLPKDAQGHKKLHYRRRSSNTEINNNNNKRERNSTSEESDYFFSLKRSKARQNVQNNRNSSSGYVSCSECSYDSDTCTCVSADKCYCSLGDRNLPKTDRNTLRKNKTSSKYPQKNKLFHHTTKEKCNCGMDSPLWCGCDTDSCAESNKCYCQVGEKIKANATIFEQLKQRGFIPSSKDSIIITPPSHRKLCKKSSNTKSTRSLEYLHNPNANDAYYEKMRMIQNQPVFVETYGTRAFRDDARRVYNEDMRRRSVGNYPMDYEVFAIDRGSVRRMANGVNYGKTYSCMDFGGVDFHRPRSRHSICYGSKAPPIQSTTITSDACHEALSVKKSAEIAALFADIKLSQTTDITHIMPEQLRRLSIVSNRAAYSRIASGKAHTKSTKYSSSDPVPYQRVVQNSLYAGKHQKNGMYSTDNGLYTIQSQSDDSRRSSVSEIIEAQKDGDEYLNVDGQKNVSSSLENSLGYLP